MNENITPLPIARIDGATIEFRMAPNHVAAAYCGTEKNARAIYKILGSYPVLTARVKELEDLALRWKKRAPKVYDEDVARTYIRCADELLAALNKEPT